MLLAWTTTPWTLPSNLALCVSDNDEFQYVKIEDKESGNKYILLKDRLVQLYPQMGGKKWKESKNKDIFTILATYKGKDLVGTRYVPIFDYFQAAYGEHAFRVVADGYVTNDGGTGIVHQAPAFGEDDFRVCIKNGIVSKTEMPCPIDWEGRYTDEVPDFQGVNVKKADDAIVQNLKDRGRLVKKTMYHHSYPHCWRSDTPLIYKAVPSWFVKVEEVKDRLLANNEKTYWVPDFVKTGRFHNWLADARDWAISRNRFWGTPMPLWTNEDCSEVVAIGSIEELAKLSGKPVEEITDLHRQFVDDIEIPAPSGNGVLRRVDEVFDCWFESGSMPYAQVHYPFENKDRFEGGFPADFIAEGLDQTRGWFYTLMVLSTCLFDKPAFKNLIVNGIVLAEDGSKMSKSKKNYPDPNLVLNEYGADPLRMYLINSPVVRAESLKFTEMGVKGVVKDLFIPWYSAFRFLVQNAGRWQATTGQLFRPSEDAAVASDNNIDAWVQAELDMLITYVHTEMGAYRLYTVMPRLVRFIDDLTKWYVRLNRERLKGSDGDDQAFTGLSVLYRVLLTVAVLMGPFTPFFAEYLYQKLKVLHPAHSSGGAPDAIGSADSVHFIDLPTVNFTPEQEQKSQIICQEMNALQVVVELGRKSRETNKVNLKKPLEQLVVVSGDPVVLNGLRKLEAYVKEELNVFNFVVTDKEDDWCTFSAKPNFGSLGKRSVCTPALLFLCLFLCLFLLLLYLPLCFSARFLWPCPRVRPSTAAPLHTDAAAVLSDAGQCLHQ